MEPSEAGVIFVESAYAQPDRSNLAIYAMSIMIDGELAGTVGPQGSWAFHVSPGSHQVQARLMWFRTHPLHVDVPAGGQSVLRADVNGEMNSPSLLIKGVFAPWKALRLEQVS